MERYKVIETYTGKGGMNPEQILYRILDTKTKELKLSCYRTEQRANEVCEKLNGKN